MAFLDVSVRSATTGLADGFPDRPGRVIALMSMPCANVGVGATCRSILRGAVGAGYAAELFTSRDDGSTPEPFTLWSAAGWPISRLPHRLIRRHTVPRTHRAFLDHLGAGDVAYLWPSVPLAVFQEVHDRGIPIVTEAINTLMRDARAVLDAEFARLGQRPTHTITATRIADEEERLSLATAIFSPSPATDASLAASAFSRLAVAASYGTSTAGRPNPPAERPGSGSVTFLFVGLSSVRKGLQRALDVWRDVPGNLRLRIVGRIDPVLRNLYADVLSLPNVSVAGYATDVAREYRAADVFVLPSLEEGDPIATYEAASWGLPLLVSAPGAGRMGTETGAARIIDTGDVAQFRQHVLDLAGSGELRRHMGRLSRDAVADYDWSLVARRRCDILTGLAGR